MTEQKQTMVLEHFKKGGSLTVLDCLRMFHTTELRRIVSRIEKMGYIVSRENVPNENYKKYYISSMVDSNNQVTMCL
jgi:hypothetical protein